MKEKVFYPLIILIVSLIILVFSHDEKDVESSLDLDSKKSASKNSNHLKQVSSNRLHANNKPLKVRKREIVVGTINVNAPGEGKGLYVTLKVNHGKLELGYNVSVPLTSLKKRTKYVNYLAVLKDDKGELIQKIPVIC